MIVGIFAVSFLVLLALFARAHATALILLGGNLLLILLMLWHLMTDTVPINW